MYILLAIIDEDSFRSDLDVKLLYTMTVHYPQILLTEQTITFHQAIATRVQGPDYPCRNAQYGKWQEWVLLESRHR
jgi:hypothetical protein